MQTNITRQTIFVYMKDKTILNLVEKYLGGTATAEDRELVEIFLTELEKGPAREFSPEEKAAKKALLLGRIKAGMYPRPARLVPLQNQWFKWAAAAAILVAVITTAYFFTRQSAPVPVSQSQNTVIDIPPGKDAAILTLADGKTIVLESTYGNIASQGGVAVINKDGNVSYQLPANSSRLEANSPLTYNTITTAKGNQYQLQLEDGTRVWLNSASSLKYPVVFKGNNRVVELSGEGYFEVAHNTSKPFIVMVNEMEVEVLGTHFNINSYADEEVIKTTLLQGKVRVSVNRKKLSANNEKQTANSLILTPGQQAQVSNHETVPRLVSNVDVEAAIAWKNGLFNLKGVNVKEIMRQVARWYNVEIEYKGDVSDINFYGVVSRRKNVSELLRVMQETGTVHFTINGNKIIVSK